ncbi:hypothetical protein KIPB_012315, partial [Kipferlia bialata]
CTTLMTEYTKTVSAMTREMGALKDQVRTLQAELEEEREGGGGRDRRRGEPERDVERERELESALAAEKAGRRKDREREREEKQRHALEREDLERERERGIEAVRAEWESDRLSWEKERDEALARQQEGEVEIDRLRAQVDDAEVDMQALRDKAASLKAKLGRETQRKDTIHSKLTELSEYLEALELLLGCETEKAESGEISFKFTRPLEPDAPPVVILLTHIHMYI